MAKSYYSILGISSDASPSEIRSAYRSLSKAYHPDHYSGNSETFLEIQEAYSVLGDSRRRQDYEQQLRNVSVRKAPVESPAYPGPEPLIPEEYPADAGDISLVRSFQRFSPSFDEIFDWLWRNFSSMEPPKSGRIQNMTLEVPLTRDQAIRGGNVRIMVPARAVCPTCRGRGSIGYYRCMRCAGEGGMTGDMPVSIAFPSGLARDHAVVLPLERFGIRNVHLTVVFRPTDE